jgi:glycosyltransferase involved in cell wall biosynthesis
VTILHVLGGDAMGGCERLSIDLAAEYAEQGLTQAVLFYGAEGSGPAWRAFEALGVTPYRIDYDGKPVHFVWALARLCRRLGVQAVLTHGFGMHLLIAAGARLGGARRVLALVGNPPPAEPVLLRRVRRRAHLARPFVTREIACSRYVRELMLREYRLPPDRVVVVHNWVRVNEIARRAGKARAARQAAIARGDESADPVMLMVARLDPIKDHATVIRAMALLQGANRGLRLRLVGDGSIRKTLEALADELGLADRVEFLGAREDIPEQLGRADLFVYGTTVDEGFGIVLAEAMAAGLPIVCTDVRPCAEVLDEGRAGVLVQSGSPQAMAEGMRVLMNDPGRAGQLAAQALAVACARYGVARAADEIKRIVQT